MKGVRKGNILRLSLVLRYVVRFLFVSERLESLLWSEAETEVTECWKLLSNFKLRLKTL
jgi:hypothetical protein